VPSGSTDRARNTGSEPGCRFHGAGGKLEADLVIHCLCWLRFLLRLRLIVGHVIGVAPRTGQLLLQRTSVSSRLARSLTSRDERQPRSSDRAGCRRGREGGFTAHPGSRPAEARVENLWNPRANHVRPVQPPRANPCTSRGPLRTIIQALAQPEYPSGKPAAPRPGTLPTFAAVEQLYSAYSVKRNEWGS